MATPEEEKLLEYSVQARQFEIGLFWQRSIFFWGFAAAAMVAYSAFTEPEDRFLRFVIACFGFLCSLAWALANRGSKYWQEAWEQKVERAEKAVVGSDLFSVVEPVKKHGLMWRAHRYSVTKLTIALSDMTTLIWLPLGAAASPGLQWEEWDWASIILLGAALAYTIAMFIGARSTVHTSN